MGGIPLAGTVGKGLPGLGFPGLGGDATPQIVGGIGRGKMGTGLGG